MNSLRNTAAKTVDTLLAATGLDQLILAKTLDLTEAQVIACLTHKQATTPLIRILTSRYPLAQKQVQIAITYQLDINLKVFLIKLLPLDQDLCQNLYTDERLHSTILLHPDCPHHLLLEMAMEGNIDALSNPSLLVEDLDQIQSKKKNSLCWLINNPNCRPEVLAAVNSQYAMHHRQIISHPNCPPDILNSALMAKKSILLVQSALKNPQVSQEILRSYYNHIDCKSWVLQNPNCPIDLLLETMLTAHSDVLLNRAVRNANANEKVLLLGLTSSYLAVKQIAITLAPIHLVRIVCCA